MKRGEKRLRLTHIAGEVEGCRRCPLALTRINVAVHRGSPSAQVMIVGEAPGADEDEVGRPFVGRSGRLLDEMLLKVGLDPRKDVYIANILKCRPPENRRPKESEIEACQSFLERQIGIMEPAFLLALGSTAMHFFFNSTVPKISEVRGEFYDLHGDGKLLCLPTFHPSYLLRNPSMAEGSPKWLFLQDLKEMKRRLDLLDTDRYAEAMEITCDFWPEMDGIE